MFSTYSNLVSLFVFLVGGWHLAHAAATAPYVEHPLTHLRALCERAVRDMDGAEHMQNVLSSATESHPVALGYKGMAEVLVAKHSYNPYTKLRSFQRGRDYIERAIGVDPTNIELRYIRMVIQSEVPSIVGYRENMQEDSTMLLRYLRDPHQKTADPELYRNVRGFLVRTGFTPSATND